MTHAATPALSGDALVRARERSRIQAILNCPEAQGREHLARHLAFSTAVDPYAAAGILASAPTAGGESSAIDRRAAAEEIRAGMDATDPGRSRLAEVAPAPAAIPGNEVSTRTAVVEAIRAGFDFNRLRHNNL